MDSFRHQLISFLVFVTGASVLIIEVVATRILSPFFGSTIYTVSSVIGVVLGALSLGYAIGGRLADRHPSLSWFFAIIFIGAISILFVQVLRMLFLPILGNSLSIIWGPLVASVLLFFLPSFFLAMLSPYAIALQRLLVKGKGVGRISGDIFFWSTLGSIVGSLSAGFFLIPQFGTDQIILGNGLFLAFIGFVGLMLSGRHKPRRATCELLFLLLLLLIVLLSSLAPQQQGLLYSHDGIYEKITIVDSSFKGKPARLLLQDRSLSGGMFLSSSDLVFPYTEYYKLYRLFIPTAKDILILGGGSYTIAKAVLGEIKEARVEVAEIEPQLYDLAKKYFNLEDDGRLKNYLEDGRKFLRQGSKTYDLIFSDVYYSLYSIPAHMITQEFFQIAKKKLNHKGIFIANIIGDLSSQSQSLAFSSMRTFETVFPNSYFFAVNSADSVETQNIIFVGYNSQKRLSFANTQAEQKSDPFFTNLLRKQIDPDRLPLSRYQILTDNFSPVEYLTAKVLKRHFAN